MPSRSIQLCRTEERAVVVCHVRATFQQISGSLRLMVIRSECDATI